MQQQEDMVMLDRKTGAKVDVPANPPPEYVIPTRKQMREMLMPSVGDMVEGKYRVVYVNTSKFWFTGVAKELDPVGTQLLHNDKVYQVDYVMPDKGRITAGFMGYKQAEVQEAPIEEDGDLVKVI